MIRILIVRHGNTFEAGETPRRIGARTDLPLTAEGRAQALRLRAHFVAQGWPFARVLASPLRRTTETALLIAATVEPAPWLTEIDHGPDEGRPEPEVLARLGQSALDEWDRAGAPPPGWRVDPAAVTAAWSRFFATCAQDTLLVTSNGTARFALAALGARPPAGLKLRPGSYGLIEDGQLTNWNTRP